MKKIVISMVFLLTAYAVFAQGWALSDTQGSRSTLSGPGGKKAVIYADIPVTDDVIAKVGTALNTVWALPGLEGTSSTVMVEEASIFRFVIYPDKLIYNKSDFKEFFPSGMAFYYNSALFYDITMKVGDLMPKVAGSYISPDDLLSEIKSASIMPDMYMYDTYFLKRLERLEKALMAVSKKNLFGQTSEVNEDIVLAVRSMYNENPKITKKEVADKLKQKNIKATAADINAVFMVYLGRIE